MLMVNDPRHGTENGYNHYGCRCDACTNAHKKYMFDYRCKRAGKQFLEENREALVTLALNLPELAQAQGCWIYDLANPLKRRTVREIMYTVTTGKVAPRLARTKTYDPGNIFLPCDPRCVRPEHINVRTNDHEPIGVEHLPEAQKAVATALTYLPHTMCWLVSANEFDAIEIMNMRMSMRTTSGGSLNRIGTCGAFNCLNSAHFAYDESESAALPPGSVVLLLDSSVKQTAGLPTGTKARKKPAALFAKAKAVHLTALPAPEKVQPKTAMQKVSSASDSLYARGLTKKDLTRRQIDMRIQEFVRRIGEDLNASVDYAACLSNKIVYDTEEKAQKAEEIWQSLSLHVVSFARSYKCHRCRYWHLTSKETWSALDARPLAHTLK